MTTGMTITIPIKVITITEQVMHATDDSISDIKKQSALRIQAYCHQLKLSWHYSKADTILITKTVILS